MDQDTTPFNKSLTMSSTTVNSTTIPSMPDGHVPWYQFPMCAAAPYGFVFYFTVKMLNLVVGTPCNALVIWQISTKKKDASTSDIFILNLAVLDVYFCLMSCVDLANRLLLGDDTIWYFQRFAYGVKDITPLFLVCICVDRYMAVAHPLLFSNVRDNKIRTGISAVVWGFVLAYALTKSLLGVMSVNEIFSGVILFAFAVMLFCNVSVIWVLRRSVAGKEVMHPVKKRALKIVLIVLAIVVINYLPPVALMPFASYYSVVAFRCQISVVVFAIMDLSCSIEPLLYITKMDGIERSCCRQKTANKV